MRAVKVTYSRLKSLGNFEHESLSLEVEVETGESAEQAAEKAKDFVCMKLGITQKEIPF